MAHAPQKSLPEESTPDDYIRQLRQKQGYMPVTDHLEELRFVILRGILYVLLLSVFAWFAYEQVYNFVMGPLLPLIAKSREAGNIDIRIVTNQLGDYFLIKMNLVMVAALVVSVPILMFELWRFIMPAIDKKFRNSGPLLIAATAALFWTGVYVSRAFIWPTIVYFLVFQWVPPSLSVPGSDIALRPELYLSVGDYLSFFFLFHAIFGLSFEMPIVAFILAAAGLINRQNYFAHWRMIVAGLSIASAALTPADVFSMLAVLVPLVILYFLSGLIVILVDKKKGSTADEN